MKKNNEDKNQNLKRIIQIIIAIIIIILFFLLGTKCSKDEPSYVDGSDILDVTYKTPVNELENNNPNVSSANLNLFANKDEFKPDVKGKIEFSIANKNKFNIEYDLTLIEDNPEKINMVFRLKKDGIYISGDNNTWVSAREVSLLGNAINSGQENDYVLECWWRPSENDDNVNVDKLYYSLRNDISAIQK